ncbi:MAG: TerC family protein [Elusimicrobia bacterium]|nr:TerC family protein [Elusimicrobiota bacterium]
MAQTWLWFLFVVAVAAMLAVDLGVLGVRAHKPSMREAAAWSAAWIGLALAFGGAIWALEGSERALLYLTGYVLEKSLSVDNLFVFLIIFRFFAIGDEHQTRVLHWGILSAVVMRFIFIYAGVSLIHRSQWVLAAFGVILLWTGGKMLLSKDKEDRGPEKNPALRLLRRVLPVTESLHGQSFFTRVAGVLHATPLFAALAVIEASDLIFAADSIPAALAVTPDLFLVYTSNIFAVMGLRSLYFLLESSLSEFRYLKTGISIALLYVGAKLLLLPWFEIPAGWSLAVIVLVLSASIAASRLWPERGGAHP